ncbi:flagella protein [Methanocaldococcus vulcanius M7]|uniref:Flagella protein n=1 Tax=Methanocaldococcus vulcanius (strain ATCC 700851 / DSM 12094 / M7) TaxID=579137 RepID=C9REG3_METVM|nr:FlaD/FlaE family flagellar protein [Methanocaldococcus vulcanius]ACX71965.1 flagella protein [Methanocaldococcus vulcanius M7]
MIQKTMNEMSSLSILSDEEILTEDEIEEYLENLKSKLPSFVIILLKNNLRGKRVTKRQLDKIIERISEVLSKGRGDKTEELNKKLHTLEQKLDTIMKLTTMAASTKLSEELEKEKPPNITIENTEEKEDHKQKGIDTLKKENVEDIKFEEDKDKEDNKKIEEERENVGGVKSEESPEEGSIMKPVEEETQYRLSDIPEDAVSMTLVFKWLEFLVSRVGVSNLPDILDYYNKIGWISNKVILKVLRFAKNMKIAFDDEALRPRDKLSPSDHIVSLLYIEKLAGRPVDPEVLEMLEIEIRRIKKWALELQML